MIQISFISFSCLIDLVSTFSTRWRRGSESRCPSLVMDHSGKVLSYFPLIMMLAVGFSYMDLIMWRNFTSIPKLLRVFIKKQS